MKSTIFYKIFTRILITFLILTFILMGSSYFYLNRTIKNDLIVYGKAISQSISSSISFEMANMDLSEFQDLLNNLTDINEIHYIYITDENYNLIIDTFSPQPPPIILNRLKNRPTLTEEFSINELNSIEVTTPILYGSLGHVFIGMNKNIIHQKLMELLPQILIAIPFLIGLCLFLLYNVIKNITNPLNKLTQFTKDIERYHFDISKTNQQDIKTLSQIDDEIGSFSKSYLNLYSELDKHIHQLTDASAKSSAIKKELSIAHDIQMNLLDQSPTAHLSKNISFSAFIEPAKDIGGDFYDVIEKNHNIYFTIGDVSGKGIAAALVASSILTSIRSFTNYLQDPTDIITSVNQQFCKHNPQTLFVTLFFGVLDTTTGTFEYINAGHASPYILSSEFSSLESTKGAVLGIDEHHYFGSKTVQFQHNTHLILTTDGVNEAHNPSNELFGDDQALSILKDLKNPTAKDCTTALTSAIQQFCDGHPPHDDITILSVMYQPTSRSIPNPLVISFENDVKELIKLQRVTQIFAKYHQLETKEEKTINLVLEELLTNTIYYGYKDNLRHVIHIRFDYQSPQLTIHIEDDGIPFNPIEDSPEIDTSAGIDDRPIGGLGIHIVKKMVDNIEYSRHDDKNRLTITKVVS